ncbi:pilus assembly protein [Shewanella surugensis]|uniref:rRNA (Guanine-N1)-methyltransferase n=2 Tax=Shewanella surugensis TaxID=212020 RepID=A0ABT0L5U4_9GAMM|nr:PilC/PilY family type IV pilus protein [Shewanella surugensis]MCL1123049.1 rRNA (guanine-N1)-methyltransferase [Shewanella surugensis]
MNNLMKWKVKWVGLCFGGLFFLIISVSYSDDTQLYVFESSARSGARPQVLIIFDTSGSMGDDEETETPYDRGESLTSTTKLYYTKGGGDIPALSSSNFIYQANNGCKSSYSMLENYGFFTGFIREYSFVGDSGSWSELSDELASSINTIDCFEDFENSAALEFINASDMGHGLPVDSLGSQASPIPYTYVSSGSSEADIASALNKAKLTNLGIGKSVTLYTERYVTWYHSDKETLTSTRMEIAKRVIEDTLVTTPSVDFGLAVFNRNSNSKHGGRVVSGIQRLDTNDKIALINTVNNLDDDGSTPLCETLYEVYRYFSGKSVFYGDNDNTSMPSRDTSIELNGSYISPFDASQCANRAYVVYMTDGVPTNDTNANSYIDDLPGYRQSERTDYEYEYDCGNNRTCTRSGTSYLPALAGILNREDVNTNLAGEQYVTTFTIGFSEGAADAAPILQAAADYGGGLYFAANDASQLQAALQQIFSQILEVNASFTSPSIASNNFDRTQTFDSVYYAMFLPNKGPRWRGNLKKFKVTGAGDIVDKNDALAIGLDGNLKSSACSYWTHTSTCSAASGGGDGNDVRIGGVAEHLMNNNSSRTLYGDFGVSGMLSVFSKNNAISRAGSESDLASYMGVASSQLDSLFNWAKGQDVDDDDNDGSTSDNRQDIFGDPLHSKPLAINFGTPAVPDLRILVGTNHGVMHMFKDVGDSVSESWAFMPYELLPNLVDLRVNVPTGVHSVYGLDSPPIAYVETGSDGVEKAWVFFGMRRGGKSYYALDITLPDSPKMMWKISSDSSGMTELGQTWSKPVITFIPKSNVDTGGQGATPVLVFGAGYSPATKDGVEQGTPDAQGRGVFIVDAKTGELIHAFGAMTGSKVTNIPTLTDSIPSSVAVLDANGDQLTDRIYAADTGGNVWRMDLPGGDPFDSEHPWTAFKFAELGAEGLSNDRRFFSEPVAVQTVFTNISEVSIEEGGETTTTVTYQKVPYDAVVIGTGHRAQPSDLSRSDNFFTLQDRNVVTKSFTGTEDGDIPEPLTLDNLYDVTAAPPVTESEYLAFGQKRGWYYHFSDNGEKSLAAATIVEGTVFFTSYVPGDLNDTDQCLISGMGRLYGFNLHRGTRAYTHEYLEMGERVPDTPQLVIPANGSDDSYMYLIGIGAAGEEMERIEDPLDDCPPEDSQCIGGQPGVNRIYVHGHE